MEKKFGHPQSKNPGAGPGLGILLLASFANRGGGDRKTLRIYGK